MLGYQLTPVVDYKFPCSIDGVPSIISDSSSRLGDVQVVNRISQNNELLSETTNTTNLILDCPYYYHLKDGVRSNQLLESTGDVSDLRPLFSQATSMTMEVWITPTFNVKYVSSILPIISIGQTSSPTSSQNNNQFCDGIQFMIGQYGNQFQIKYKDHFEYENNESATQRNYDIYSCRILDIKDYIIKYQELHHIVIQWINGGSIFLIHINGDEIVRINLSGGNDYALTRLLYNLQSWDLNYNLQLFSNHMTDNVFTGTIHQVSIYNQELQQFDIERLYRDGIVGREQKYDFNPDEPLYLLASPVEVDTEASVIQEETLSFSMGGKYNMSTPYWDIMVEMITLPKYGNLLMSNGSIAGRIGDRIRLEEGQTIARLMYRQKVEDYFSIPTHSFNGTILPHKSETFSYRLVAISKNDPNQLFGWSEPVNQRIKVIHRNHPPKLIAPEKVTRPPGQSYEVGTFPYAVLGDIELQDDADYNIDRVRVDIWAYNGSLSIQSNTIKQMADFRSCAKRPTNMLSSDIAWQCHGDGKKDRNMTFIATPDNVTAILAAIQYNAFDWNQQDSIILRIFDGSGGGCLSEEEHLLGRPSFSDRNGVIQPYETYHEDCFQIVTSIQVPAFAQGIDPNDMGGINGFFNDLFDFQNFGIPDLIFWILLIMFCMACCCCIYTIKVCITPCIRRRGGVVMVHVEDNPPSRIKEDGIGDVHLDDIEIGLEDGTDSNSDAGSCNSPV